MSNKNIKNNTICALLIVTIITIIVGVGILGTEICSNSSPIELFKLKHENDLLNSQIQTLECKLKSITEKYYVLRTQPEYVKNQEMQKLIQTNERLSDELKQLRFDLENDARSIPIKIENEKLKSQIEVKEYEIKQLKALIEAYRLGVIYEQ